MMMMMYVCEKEVCLLCAGSECERREERRRGVREVRLSRALSESGRLFPKFSASFHLFIRVRPSLRFVALIPWRESLWYVVLINALNVVTVLLSKVCWFTMWLICPGSWYPLGH